MRRARRQHGPANSIGGLRRALHPVLQHARVLGPGLGQRQPELRRGHAACRLGRLHLRHVDNRAGHQRELGGQAVPRPGRQRVCRQRHQLLHQPERDHEPDQRLLLQQELWRCGHLGRRVRRRECLPRPDVHAVDEDRADKRARESSGEKLPRNGWGGEMKLVNKTTCMISFVFLGPSIFLILLKSWGI